MVSDGPIPATIRMSAFNPSSIADRLAPERYGTIQVVDFGSLRWLPLATPSGSQRTSMGPGQRSRTPGGHLRPELAILFKRRI